MKLNLAIPALLVSTSGKHGGVPAEMIRGSMPQRRLSPDLVYIGEYEHNPGLFPLGWCQGDCDNDSQCKPPLKCFKREPGSTKKIFRCEAGGTGDITGKDYCTIRGVDWLLKVGDNGIREDNGLNMTADPLGMCEGDCDEDNHCQPGLKCFHRSDLFDPNEDIPLCNNRGGDPAEDYCTPDVY